MSGLAFFSFFGFFAVSIITKCFLCTTLQLCITVMDLRTSCVMAIAPARPPCACGTKVRVVDWLKYWYNRCCTDKEVFPRDQPFSNAKFSQCTFSVAEHYDLFIVFSGLIILRQV